MGFGPRVSPKVDFRLDAKKKNRTPVREISGFLLGGVAGLKPKPNSQSYGQGPPSSFPAARSSVASTRPSVASTFAAIPSSSPSRRGMHGLRTDQSGKRAQTRQCSVAPFFSFLFSVFLFPRGCPTKNGLPQKGFPFFPVTEQLRLPTSTAVSL